MAISVRDDMRGLVQRAGLGASAMLSAVDDDDKPAVVSALQYPKNELEVLWGGFNNLHADKELLVRVCDCHNVIHVIHPCFAIVRILLI